ncbi:hypothetical protein [Fibrobacter sp. UWB8]|uniref:hypothetical protein n=1 Tax=Fibrobacter sp. UWB8 TaxID=1896207 RepID=UPI001160DA62|nr:hypothetical protein [Fibrobacter sp. UWB8]
MKQTKNRLQIIQNVMFATYAFVVLSTSSIVACSSGLYSGILLLLAGLIICAFVSKINTFVRGFSIHPSTSFSFLKTMFFFVLLALGVLLFWFMGTYPGAFSYDSINQFEQAIYGTYSDWHPVLHTLLFFTLPIKIFNCIESIVIFQIICFSILFGYMETTLYEYGGKKFAIISAAFILSSPFTLNIVMHPWKDVPFAMICATCLLYSVRIYLSNGEWAKRKTNLILTALMLAFASVFRHNGILFSIPLLGTLYFLLPKKKWILLILTSLLIAGSIKVPLYSYLDVSKPGNRVTETMGLPLSIILNVAKECPKSLDNQTSIFVKEITSVQPNWIDNFDINRGFSSIKYDGIDFNLIEKTGRLAIIKMALKSALSSPKQAVLSFIGLTNIVYGINGAGIIGQGIEPNKFGINWGGNYHIKSFQLNYITLIQKSLLTYILCSVGFPILMIITFIIFKFNRHSQTILKFALCSPILIYSFGTMLFLTGKDVRFFYLTYLTTPVAILLLSADKKETFT